LLDVVIGFVLFLLWVYVFSWIMVYVGLLVLSFEVVNNVLFVVIFLVMFIVNMFVLLEMLFGLFKMFVVWNLFLVVIWVCWEWFGNLFVGV